MSERDLQAIEALAQRVPEGGTIVEVGSFLGRSAWAFAKSCHPTVTVYTVDAWAWMPEDYGADQPGGPLDPRDDPKPMFDRNVADCPNIVAIRGVSPDVHVPVPAGGFDLVFLDAGHTNPGIANDIGGWYELLRKPGGIFSGDDYSPEYWPDVVLEVSRCARRIGAGLHLLGDKLWAFYL